MKLKHKTVLLKEVISGLNIINNGIYVDCTLGRAGHSLEILKNIPNGKLFCFEQDKSAITESIQIFKKNKYNNYEIINNNFINLKDELYLRKVKIVNGILYDLGLSSPQLDDFRRGFSYRYNGFLDMRMNQNQILTAKTIINTYSQKSLINIFQNYGEERFSKKIAKNIIIYRNKKEIITTFHLVYIIKNSLPQKILKKAKHPAKKIFQALRIEVNKELFVLKKSLQQAVKLLSINGYLLVISFNSLEDRIVKKYFKNLTKDPNYEINSQIPIISNFKSNYQIITKKAIIPLIKEQIINHRSKSAKLRILKRIK